MYKLEYDYDERIIYKVYNGEKESTPFEFPSEPIVSPDGKSTVFIDPLEWESLGTLYIFDNTIGGFETLIEHENDFTPKYVKWLDHKTLGVIIGYGYGTVAIGGNLYTYDLANKEKKQITEFESNIQITSFDVLEGNKVKCKGIKYTDDILNQFIEFEDIVQL
ncbi:DUF4652 domain-containing protein [Bacillus bingmayongensis]|uniref:DUF4652 domain-containing protein n=1 Tax=Bacillus bingmayongensis TaxID=1150157 RepID=UPI0002FE56BB|nr:DUF4652 domain-containing protein [Bacillus bingmayongensis]